MRTEGSKYVWFGTDHVFDAFTFAFRETEHGLFNAHAYPYDERMSTFIVECPEEVWRSAGLDEMDEQESLAFCEQLFANELRGRELFSNRSLWLDFPKVTNKTWYDGNVVLLGDAVHTAHFSIGSGTKLAMEDSIALAAALARRRWDLDAAFVDYELERAPFVERTQEAASESAAYFGRIASYSHLEPIQFAFNLITRAGRITHATLGVRDPQFTRALDAWLGGRRVSPPPAFAPFELRGVRFENRFELVEHTAAVSAGGSDRSASRRVDGWGLPRARFCSAWPTQGGAAQLVRARRVSTCPSRTAGRWSRRRRGPTARSVRFRAARRGCRRLRPSSPLRASRPGRRAGNRHGPRLSARQLPVASDERRGRSAAVSAPRCSRPCARPGPGRSRCASRSPTGIRAETRSTTGSRSRASSPEHGCDLIHVEAGQTIHDDRPQYRRGFLTALSDRVRNEAHVPTLVGGYLTTLDEANTIIGAGRADLVLLDLPETQIERPVTTSDTAVAR